MSNGFAASRRAGLLVAFLAAAGLAPSALAAPITLVSGTVNMFRDTRGANDVGITQGDLFQFGANIVGGSLGTSLGATYPASGFTISQFDCAPLIVNPNFCARTTAFNSNRLDPWTLRFVNGSDVLTVTGPTLAGTLSAVPFANSVTLSGTGLTPTISWDVPGAFAPDGFRINVFDKNRRLANGSADIIHSVAISSSATSYTLPTTLSSGLALSTGGNYSINFQLIETRGHVAFTNNNAEILRRSNSYFAFTPLTGSVPGDVALPTVVNGVYNFDIGSVGPGSITFIDPFVAVGYDYAIGAGNPNFASVLLPDIGDGAFTLAYTPSGGLATTVTLDEGSQFFFPTGGVSAFRVTGIETSAGLDPANATAFITGLTFISQGSFTGTMTPLTVFVPVPEPTQAALLLGGMLLLIGWRRRSR